MAYDGTLKFDTSVDSGGFKNGITKISSIAKIGLKTAVTAITAVTGALSAGAAAGVKYNAQMEQYITSFGTMLGSAEKATVLVNDLKEMGAKTPFETSDLAKGSQTLLAFGVAADDLLPTLQMLGDVSQGNKERFDSLTLAFAQVSSAGKLTGQDLLQFVNAGFNPLNEICKVTGESMEEVRDRMSKGGVSADEVAQAFKRATGEGGQFYQAMEAQSQTFNGQMSTLKDNVMSFVGDLTQGVSGTLKDEILPMVNGWLGELQTAFSEGGVEGVVSALGGVIADACTQLAQAAPGVVELAVNFIQSFISGISDNKRELLSAAKEIVSALVNGLVDLLPSEIQKPVKETVEALTKSFQSGGLRSAINTIRTTLQNLGKVATNLAKALLPPLAKAVDFLADNLDILLPLVTGIVATLKTMSIVKSVTTWMTGLKTALGLATVATQGATTAQLALNGAMSANPIGIVIGLVGGLVTALGTLWATAEHTASVSERLNDANQAIADSYANVGQKMQEFQQGIETADSYLSNFNTTMFTSAESQQALEDEMQRIQDGITAICKLASDERRGYTDQEIIQLDNYFQRLNELQEQQLEVQQLRTEAITQQGVTAAQSFSGSLAEYEAESQRWTATAQEQADKQIKIIEDQTINELALLNQRYGDQANLSNTAYAEEYNALMQRKQERITAAQEEVAKVTGAFSDGYIERADALKEYLTHQADVNLQEELETERHNSVVEDLRDRNAAGEIGIREKLALEEHRHEMNMADIRERRSQGMTEEVKQQLSAWMVLLTNTELYGGDITTENKELAKAWLAAYDSLPEEMKEQAKYQFQGMLKGYEEEEPGLLAKAGSVADSLIGIFLDKFGIASPSKVMKRIYRQLLQGGEVGFDSESPKLLKKAGEISSGVLKRFSPKLDVSAMVAKMKATVAAQRYSLSASLGGAAAGGMTLGMNTSGIENAVRQGLNGARVEADGRQIGKVVMANWDRTVRTFGR